MISVRDVTDYQILIDKKQKPLTAKMIRFYPKPGGVDVNTKLEENGCRMAKVEEINLLLKGYPDLSKRNILPLGPLKNGHVVTNQSDLWIVGIPFKCVLNTIKPRN